VTDVHADQVPAQPDTATEIRGAPQQDLPESRALYETTQELCSLLDLDQVLASIVRRAKQLLNGDVAYLATADAAQQVLRMRASDNITSERFRNLVIPFSVGLGGAVAAERRPVATTDYLEEHGIEHSSYIDEIVQEEALRSAVAVPVEFQQRLLAVLFVARQGRTRFTSNEVTLLGGLANSAAIAMNNAQIHEKLSKAMLIHKNLMDLALADRGPQAIAATLAGLVSGPVLLLDWIGADIAQADFHGRTLTAPGRDELEAAAASSHDGVTLAMGQENWLVRAIRIGAETEGYLLVEPSPEEADFAPVAAEQAATVFALELAKRRSADQTESQLRGDMLDDLLTEPLQNEQVLVRRAARFGVDLYATHSMVVLKPRQPQSADVTGTRWTRVTQLIAARVRARDDTFVVRRRDAVVILLPAASGQEAHASVLALVDACRRDGMPDLVAGIGAIRAEPADYGQSFREASRAVEAAQRLKHLQGVVHFDSLEYHQLVLGARPSDDLVPLARDELRPLVEYDATAKGGSLTATLTSYLEACGNVEAAARKASCHPNTFRMRLSRIESLLGRDLQDAATRLDLQLALATIKLAEG
jgi:sugar diacid utilization regulator